MVETKKGMRDKERAEKAAAIMWSIVTSSAAGMNKTIGFTSPLGEEENLSNCRTQCSTDVGVCCDYFILQPVIP